MGAGLRIGGHRFAAPQSRARKEAVGDQRRARKEAGGDQSHGRKPVDKNPQAQIRGQAGRSIRSQVSPGLRPVL